MKINTERVHIKTDNIIVDLFMGACIAVVSFFGIFIFGLAASMSGNSEMGAIISAIFLLVVLKKRAEIQ